MAGTYLIILTEMKINFRIPVFFILILGFLIITNAILYFQKTSYSYKNEKLILENDSIKSVNIELKDSIDKIIWEVKASEKDKEGTGGK